MFTSESSGSKKCRRCELAVMVGTRTSNGVKQVILLEQKVASVEQVINDLTLRARELGSENRKQTLVWAGSMGSNSCTRRFFDGGTGRAAGQSRQHCGACQGASGIQKELSGAVDCCLCHCIF